MHIIHDNVVRVAVLELFKEFAKQSESSIQIGKIKNFSHQLYCYFLVIVYKSLAGQQRLGLTQLAQNQLQGVSLLSREILMHYLDSVQIIKAIVLNSAQRFKSVGLIGHNSFETVTSA
jgi:hypothetical protein